MTNFPGHDLYRVPFGVHTAMLLSLCLLIKWQTLVYGCCLKYIHPVGVFSEQFLEAKITTVRTVSVLQQYILHFQ